MELGFVLFLLAIVYCLLNPDAGKRSGDVNRYDTLYGGEDEAD